MENRPGSQDGSPSTIADLLDATPDVEDGHYVSKCPTHKDDGLNIAFDLDEHGAWMTTSCGCHPHEVIDTIESVRDTDVGETVRRYVAPDKRAGVIAAEQTQEKRRQESVASGTGGRFGVELEEIFRGVLKHLGTPFRGGNRYPCPNCGDKRHGGMKVDLKNGKDGKPKILLNCFADCAQDDIVAAAGLTWADLDVPRDPGDVFGFSGPSDFREQLLPKVDTSKRPPFESRLLTAAQLAALKPPEWLVDGLMPERGTWRLYGPSGSYKSFVALSLAAEIGRGGEWSGKKCQKGDVLYIVAEGAPGMSKRVRAWEKHHNEEMRGVTFAPWPLQIGGQDWTDLVEHARRVRYAFVVFDTQARVTAGKEENSAKDMGIVMHYLTSLAEECDGAVGTVHHTGYNTDHARGSTAIFAAVDTELSVTKSGEFARITVAKQKDGEDGTTHTLTRVVIDVGDAFRHETSLVFVDGFEPRAAPDPLDLWMVEVLRDRKEPVNGATALASLIRDGKKDRKVANQKVGDRVNAIILNGGTREVQDGVILVEERDGGKGYAVSFQLAGRPSGLGTRGELSG